MHRSRLGALIIDCETDDLAGAAAFWSQALGIPKQSSDDPADTKYVSLTTPTDEINIEVQQVEHPSRVHIDIETDDLEAEIQRLEGLGARRLEHIRTWCVMEAPTGQRFCVVPQQRSDFHINANVWD